VVGLRLLAAMPLTDGAQLPLLGRGACHSTAC
jgi:hypothetical protein